MRKSDWAVDDTRLHEHARCGVIRAETLEGLGIPQSTTYRQCQPGGRWRHLLPGIVMLGRAEPTDRQRIEAALMHARHAALVTGFDAARLYGLRKVPKTGFVHTLIPHGFRILSSGFAVVERTRFFPRAVVRDGLPLAPPARAILDGVRRIRDRDPVRSLLIEAVQSGLTNVDALRRELHTGTKRGIALPKRVLDEVEFGPRSVAEADAIELWRRAGLPTPMCNVRVYDSAGQYVGMPDLWCDEVAMAWEIDSYQFHYEHADYARTLDRNARYAAAGVALLQSLPGRLRTDPDGVIAELRATHSTAAGRPRPQVCAAREPA